MMTIEPPNWACKRWGERGHNWTQCPECSEGYDRFIEEANESFDRDYQTTHDEIDALYLDHDTVGG
jgi:hypothetical protein